MSQECLFYKRCTAAADIAQIEAQIEGSIEDLQQPGLAYKLGRAIFKVIALSLHPSQRMILQSGSMPPLIEACTTCPRQAPTAPEQAWYEHRQRFRLHASSRKQSDANKKNLLRGSFWHIKLPDHPRWNGSHELAGCLFFEKFVVLVD